MLTFGTGIERRCSRMASCCPHRIGTWKFRVAKPKRGRPPRVPARRKPRFSGLDCPGERVPGASATRCSGRRVHFSAARSASGFDQFAAAASARGCRSAPRNVCGPGRRHGRRPRGGPPGLRRAAFQRFQSKLPMWAHQSSTVMSRRGASFAPTILVKAFPTRHRFAAHRAHGRGDGEGFNQYAPMEGVMELREAGREEAGPFLRRSVNPNRR